MDLEENTQLRTCGNYSTEPESVAEFDKFIASSGLFSIKPEVRGEIIQPRIHTKDKGVRVDRLLFPTQRLVGMGWDHGIIGVECKKSNMKIGAVFAQTMDYSRAVWTSSGSGIMVMCKYYFIWPLGKVSGPIHSIMQQQRIGGVYVTSDNPQWAAILFHMGDGGTVLRYTFSSKEIQIGKGVAGSKVGSR